MARAAAACGGGELADGVGEVVVLAVLVDGEAEVLEDRDRRLHDRLQLAEERSEVLGGRSSKSQPEDQGRRGRAGG